MYFNAIFKLSSSAHTGYKSVLHFFSKILLLAIAYFACAKLGLAIPYIGTHITLIWLPTGIAVAALLRWGNRYWPGIFAGALITNFSIDVSPLLDTCIAIGNTLGPLLSVWLLRRLKFQGALDRPHDILLLIATAAIGMLVSAGGGVSSLVIFDVLQLNDAPIAWLSWWAGDFVGVLLALPILLNISKSTIKELATQQLEFITCAVISVVLSWVVFYLNIKIDTHPLPLVFILLPVIVWSAMRFKITGSSLCLMIPVLIAAISTSRGLGPLYIEGFRHGLFLLWLFIATLVVLNLMVTALQAARNSSDAKVIRMIKLYAALNQFNQSILRCEKEQELYAQVCRAAVQFGGLQMAWIGLINQQNTLIKPVASFGAGTEYLDDLKISVNANDPLGRGPTGVSIRENRPVWCQDFQHDPSTAPWHVRGESVGWGSSASLPLRRNGKTIGTFSLYESETNAFDEATQNLLLEMATAISNALTRLSLQAERDDAEDAIRIAAVTFETQEGIMITNPEGNILRVNQAFQDITGYAEEEVIGKNPRILQSGRHDAAFYQSMWSNIINTGQWKGEVWDKRKNNEIYPKNLTITAVKDDAQCVTNYVAVFHDISKLKKSEQEIHQLAFYDPLTQLPNRRLLMDRLQQAMASSMRSGRYGALLFLDLDQFKVINDTQGHGTGDHLLIEVARRLQNCVRVDDTVARLGGDEFVAVLSGLSSDAAEAATQTEVIAEKIRQELGKPYVLDKFKCNSTVSIGASLFLAQQESEESLLQHADVAMYQAKSAGRNVIRFFDPQMQTALDMRAGMETDLRHAIDKQQLRLHYQIQVDSLQHVLGAEVLIRWEHHEHGLISPMQFIPLSEDTGLIVPIGLWVLKTACEQLNKWHHDPLTSSLTLAVNVSAKQFRQADFVSQVQRALQESGAKPSRLKLELTESTVLENVEDTILKMREIKALGVSFSMDDFGTGYSSLQYLKRLPLNQIKIDQSFVRDIATDPNDAAIVQTIIAMTEALGLDVIAEGVETEAQQEFLKLRGCHAFQGYLFGKPVPIEEFEEKLHNT
jgi:diguanylate cyclase (GGDEF)-like protein/PAS domain S-box-containing protein